VSGTGVRDSIDSKLLNLSTATYRWFGIVHNVV